jgi:hypothetical protein
MEENDKDEYNLLGSLLRVALGNGFQNKNKKQTEKCMNMHFVSSGRRIVERPRSRWKHHSDI